MVSANNLLLFEINFLGYLCAGAITGAITLGIAPQILNLPNASHFPSEEGVIRKELREIGSNPGVFGENYFLDARNAVWAYRIDKIAEGIKDEKCRKAVIAMNAGAAHGGLVNLLENPVERDRILEKFKEDFNRLPNSVNYVTRMDLNKDGSAVCQSIKMPLVKD